jgi:hypothetical protein
MKDIEVDYTSIARPSFITGDGIRWTRLGKPLTLVTPSDWITATALPALRKFRSLALPKR